MAEEWYQSMIHGWEIWLFFTAAMIMAVLAAIVWKHRTTPGTFAFAIMVSAESQWITGILLYLISSSFQEKLFWLYYYILALYLTSAAWLVMALQLTGYWRLVKRRMIVAVGLFLLVIYILTVRNDHGWFFGHLHLVESKLVGLRGPLYWLDMIFQFLMVLAGIVSFLLRYFQTTGSIRRRMSLMLLGILPVLLAVGINLYYLSVFQHPVFEPFPIAFALSGVIFVRGIVRWRFFDTLQFAQTIVTRNMGDCLIVLDAQGYLVDLNPVAEEFISKTAEMAIGKQSLEVLGFWPFLLEIVSGTEKQTIEGCYSGKDYRIHLTPLADIHRNSSQRQLGKVILLQDITAWKRAQNQLSEQQKALAVLAERDRISRELHDGPGQIWSYLNMQTEAIQTLLDKGKVAPAQALLEQLTRVTKDFNVDLRESIIGLQTAATSNQSFITTLQEYLQWFEQNYRIRTKLTFSGNFSDELLPIAAEIQLLRIIQEALTNVRKHANAHQIQIILMFRDDLAEIILEDDGCGCDPAAIINKKGSYGLKIIRERVNEISGKFSFDSQPGVGTRVKITIPLDNERKLHENIFG